VREVRRILSREDIIHKCWWQYCDGKEERKEEEATNAKSLGKGKQYL
jgi:hypothetical protein